MKRLNSCQSLPPDLHPFEDLPAVGVCVEGALRAEVGGETTDHLPPDCVTVNDIKQVCQSLRHYCKGFTKWYISQQL